MIGRWRSQRRRRRLRAQRRAQGLAPELPIDRARAERLIRAHEPWPDNAPTITETVRGYSADWRTRPTRITTLDAYTGDLDTQQRGPR